MTGSWSKGDSETRTASAGPDRRGHSLAADLTSDRGLMAFVSEVGDALDVSLVDVWVFVPEREALVYEAVWRRGGDEAETIGALGTWVALEERPDLKSVIEAGTAVERHVDDPDLSPRLRTFFEGRGYRSVFDAPLRVGGETVGVLGVVETRRVRRFEGHDRDLLDRICDLAALGAQNAWARRRDAEREEHLGILLGASRALAATIDHAEALDRVTDAVSRLLGGMRHETAVFLRQDDDSFAMVGDDGRPAVRGDDGRPGVADDGRPGVGDDDERLLTAPADGGPLTADGEPDNLAARALARHRPAQARTARVPSRLVLPLVAAGEPLGFVDVRGRPLRLFGSDEIMVLEVLADQAAAALIHARSGRAAGRQAALDPMTGFFNRWYFYDRLYSETARAYRYKQPLSVALLGVDGFDDYVRERGRVDADAVLKSIARLLSASLRRKVDVACIHADGEFGLLLPNTPPFKPGAALVAQRLRRAVEAMEFRNEEHVPLGRFTLSVGVAGYPRHADDADELGTLAAETLAAARGHGGNRVHVYGAAADAFAPDSELEEQGADVAQHGAGEPTPEDEIAALIRPPDWDEYGDEDDLPLTADHTGRGGDAGRRGEGRRGLGRPGTGPGRPHRGGRHQAPVEWLEEGDQ